MPLPSPRAMLSKSFIQFSLEGWGCVSSLLFGLRPNYGSGNGGNSCIHRPDPAAGTVNPCLCQRFLDTQASLDQSLVGLLLLSPGSWCAQGFACALQEFVSPDLWKFCNQIPLASKVKFLGGSQSLCWIPRLGNLLWILVLS